MYDVEYLYMESVMSHHLARILSRRCMEDASLCLCFGPAPSRGCAVGNRSLHGGGTEQALSKHGDTAKALCRLVIGKL